MAEGFDHTKAIPGGPLPSITEMYRRKEAECDSLEAKLKAAKQALAQERERVRELEAQTERDENTIIGQGRRLEEVARQRDELVEVIRRYVLAATDGDILDPEFEDAWDALRHIAEGGGRRDG